MVAALAFFKGLPWKWIGPGLLLVALAFLAVRGINAVKGWREDIYNEAYAAGQQQANAAWLQTRNTEAAQAIDRLSQQLEDRDTAVQGYLADIADRKPLVQQITREIDRYASTPAGATVCLDADGVRLVEQARAAATASPGRSGTNPEPGPEAR